MKKFQNREEKISFLRAALKGDSSTLKALLEEDDKSVSATDIFLCFHYLLEHGRPENYTSGLKYSDCCVTSPDNLMVLEAGIETFYETNSYDQISSEALSIMLECMECFLILKERKQLNLLIPYNKFVSN